MSYQSDEEEALNEYMDCFQGFSSRRANIYTYVGDQGMSVVEAAFKAGYKAALGITEVYDD